MVKPRCKNAPRGVSPNEERNAWLVRSWIEDVLLSKWDGKTLKMDYVRRRAPEYWQEDYLAHDDSPGGRENMLMKLDSLAKTCSDVQIEILSLFAKNDMVADCLQVTATQTNPSGALATLRKITWVQDEVLRIKDGRIAESWATKDWLASLQKIGAISLRHRQPGLPLEAQDTTKPK